ncbi:hypothetical protein LTR05_002087 [Lithohypha guttulata]|uniref:Uncharacterized protein n=1 Tax=Lithohypha guttulata TaxID=1690604 RepID=A0AAN7T309_9EURO|nr:hypothetical protein LTR05_002087 [Lithohypha guttulata]
MLRTWLGLIMTGAHRKPVAESSFIDSLKVLPDIVYRGAGTLHLTLGVMDLSKDTEMQKATDLLRSLDLEKILRDASEGPPAGMKSQRRWKEKREGNDSITSACSDSNVIGQKETGVVEDELSVQVEQESDSVPKNALGKEQTPISSKDENRDTDVKSLERTVSPPTLARQPSTITPSPKPLYLSLTGIKAFPSAKKARVIWARPRAQLPTPPQSELNDQPQRPTFDEKEGDRLYNFALHLHQAFKDAGLVNETRQPVLHATLANMRYKVQAKGGRETKGKAWKYGKKRWEEGLVDIRPLAEVFNRFDGDVAAAQEGIRLRDAHAADVRNSESEDDEGEDGEVKNDTEARDDREREDPSKEYVWCKDIKVDRIAICKMGATKSEDPVWKEWYPPVVERVMFDEEKVVEKCSSASQAR